MGFAAMLADEYKLIFSPVSAEVRAWRSLFSFLLLTSILYFQLGYGSGQDIIAKFHVIFKQ